METIKLSRKEIEKNSHQTSCQSLLHWLISGYSKMDFNDRAWAVKFVIKFIKNSK
jgi:hypothetical protein